MSVKKSDFEATLSRLESLAKAQGATQVHHTAKDSNPGEHSGVKTNDYLDEHGGDIYIDENGTDYAGVKKALAMKVEKSLALTPAEVAVVKGDAEGARSAISYKVSKGGSLTSVESWVCKGGYDKMKKMCEDEEEGDMDKMAYNVKKANYAPQKPGGDKPSPAPEAGEAKGCYGAPDTHAGDDESDEVQEDAKKSLEGAIGNTQELRKGIEMSPVLAEFARAMGEALRGTEFRVQNAVVKAIGTLTSRIETVEKSLNSYASEQGEFSKGFAETLVGIGQHVAGNSEIAAAQASQPVSAPKSHVRAVNKSFGPGGLNINENTIAKSQMIDSMVELVQKGKLNQLEVVKFETTGEINPQVQKMVLAHATGQN